jgi:hypothetical protein
MRIVRGYTPNGTFGSWYDDDGEFICFSMEREWRNNQPNVSCVPEGQYALIEHYSPSFGETYALLNHDLGVGVYPGESHRSLILIHKANWVRQLEGCIAPGTVIGTLDDEWAVRRSGEAYEKVIAAIESGDGVLEITHEEGNWDAAE